MLASMMIFVPSAHSSRHDVRSRLSRGSSERHTAQSQPMAGTPVDVPVPSKVARIAGSMPGNRAPHGRIRYHSRMGRRVVVLGAGLAGLSTSLHLPPAFDV